MEFTVTVQRSNVEVNKPTQSAFENTSKIRVVSLFSGCGGMDLGFIGGFSVFGRNYPKLPFEIVWSNEKNSAACRTYRRNIADHIREGDVWDFLDDLPNDTDVVIGGFPCQDISINGKGLGVDGARSGQYRAMVETIRRTQPKMFVAENVKGLLLKSRRDSLSRILDDFEALGYKISYQLYNAADYGVPQTRERVFIIGQLDDSQDFVRPAAPKSKDTWMPVSEAIDDLAFLPADDSFNHVWSKANVSGEQGNRRLKRDRPGYTIRAECHGNIQFHYANNRRISMREAARIQSFPDDFIFDAKLRETERQIGNAVPPVLAWHIARSVAACLIDCRK